MAAVESDVKGGEGEGEGGEGEREAMTSALLAAAAEGDCERIRGLVAAGCDVNASERQVPCMCACIYVCMYTRIYVCMYIRVYSVCIIRIYVYTYIYACIYVCMYIRIYVCMYIRVYIGS